MVKRIIIAGTLALSAASAQASPVCDVADARDAMQRAIVSGETCLGVIQAYGLEYASVHAKQDCMDTIKHVAVVEAAAKRVEGHDCRVFRNAPSVEVQDRFQTMGRRLQEVLGAR